MGSTTSIQWEAVIGLEIHVELNTQSKIFSPARNRFGDEPNTNISYVCTGQPGSLPVLNREVVHKAALFGAAVGADVQTFSMFDRKSYFYPDSPRNFQITQFSFPIIRGGRVTAPTADGDKVFTISEAHLEDDAGMLKHFTKFAGVDYNRAGVPLIEIVSDPCIHSPQEAVAYASQIKAILQYLDASDCNMEEGSFRMDANVSVRPQGSSELRNKTEIKNMNSFSNMELALEKEISRQIRLYEDNPDTNIEELVQQATYRWNPEKRDIVLMRRKETASDYRYFPEPDLPPIRLTQEYINSVHEELPELPQAKYHRYIDKLGVSAYSAAILTSEKALADYFEQGLQSTSNAQALCNWMTVEFAGRLKESGMTIIQLGIPAKHVAELVNFIDSGKITGKIAKKVADDMVSSPQKSPEEIVAENPDYQPMNDQAAIEKVVDETLQENEQSIADYKEGKTRAFGFLVGQVMKKTKGKADPKMVNQLLKQRLEE